MTKVFRFFYRHKFALALVTLLSLFLAPILFDTYKPPSPEQWHCRLAGPFGDPLLTKRPTDSLKIIELTNSGEFVERCQLTDVLYELNWDRSDQAGGQKPNYDLNAPFKPKLALLYVHGWKHEGAEADLNEFKELIFDLKKRHRDRYVVGIYVTWNASTILPEPFRSASFWIKKADADRISQGGAVTKIVSTIGAVIKQSGQDQFITLGHSFGARILYSATAQSLVNQSQFAHPGHDSGSYKPFRGVADAVILLNPAFEASRFTVLDDFTRAGENYTAEQKPLLISISSESDWATKYAFPLGQLFDLSNTAKERTTIGNYWCYRSHTLEVSNGNNCNPIGPPGLSENFDKAGLCLKRVKRQDQDCESLSADPRNVVRRTYHPYNPFIIASTPDTVMSGHGDIWNSRLRAWLWEFISALEDRPPPQTPPP